MTRVGAQGWAKWLNQPWCPLLGPIPHLEPELAKSATEAIKNARALIGLGFADYDWIETPDFVDERDMAPRIEAAGSLPSWLVDSVRHMFDNNGPVWEYIEAYHRNYWDEPSISSGIRELTVSPNELDPTWILLESHRNVMVDRRVPDHSVFAVLGIKLAWTALQELAANRQEQGQQLSTWAGYFVSLGRTAKEELERTHAEAKARKDAITTKQSNAGKGKKGQIGPVRKGINYLCNSVANPDLEALLALIADGPEMEMLFECRAIPVCFESVDRQERRVEYSLEGDRYGQITFSTIRNYISNYKRTLRLRTSSSA